MSDPKFKANQKAKATTNDGNSYVGVLTGFDAGVENGYMMQGLCGTNVFVMEKNIKPCDDKEFALWEELFSF